MSVLSSLFAAITDWIKIAETSNFPIIDPLSSRKQIVPLGISDFPTTTKTTKKKQKEKEIFEKKFIDISCPQRNFPKRKKRHVFALFLIQFIFIFACVTWMKALLGIIRATKVSYRLDHNLLE